MLRLPLTAVLVLLVALPQGICFCDFLHSNPVQTESCCEPQSCQAPVQPSDDADDHDRDCSCKLREVLGVSPAPIQPGLDDAPFSIPAAAGAMELTAKTHVLSRSSSFMPFDGPMPLTLRALRI